MPYFYQQKLSLKFRCIFTADNKRGKSLFIAKIIKHLLLGYFHFNLLSIIRLNKQIVSLESLTLIADHVNFRFYVSCIFLVGFVNSKITSQNDSNEIGYFISCRVHNSVFLLKSCSHSKFFLVHNCVVICVCVNPPDSLKGQTVCDHVGFMSIL